MNPASPTPETSTTPATLAEQIRTILAASAKPMTLAKIKDALGKLLPNKTKGKKGDPKEPIPLDGDILRELNAEIAAKRAFEHPEGKYGKDAPPVVKSPLELMEEMVREKLAKLKDGPFAASKLGQPKLGKGASAKGVFEAKQQAFEAAVAKLVAEGELFEHPEGKYGRVAPPVVKSLLELMDEAVREKLAGLGDGPFPANKIGRPTPAKGAAAMQAFEAAVAKLVSEGKLFEHPSGQYGKLPPKPWYEAAPHLTTYNALLKSVDKLLAGGITGERLLAALRSRLKLAESASETVEPPLAPKPTPEHGPAPKPQPAIKPPVAPPVDMKAELKKAYDHLHRVTDNPQIEVRALYHQLRKTHSDLGVAELHEQLWAMHNGRILELRVLNELPQAKELDLAVQRNGHLYYYMVWN